MAAIIHRICWLDETVAGNPKISQFDLGDVHHGTIEANGFYIGYGGVNPYWPGGGYRPRYLIWRHSANLYAVFCGRGPNNVRRDWLEASPRNGLRGIPYCEQATHSWRVFYVSGTYISTGEPFANVLVTFVNQPPAPSDVSVDTPWVRLAQDVSITSLLPAIAGTIAGFDLPSYVDVDADQINGEELD